MTPGMRAAEALYQAKKLDWPAHLPEVAAIIDRETGAGELAAALQAYQDACPAHTYWSEKLRDQLYAKGSKALARHAPATEAINTERTVQNGSDD